jgi:hypothetical protein
MDLANDLGICSYSSNGTHWTMLGEPFNLAYDWQTGTFQGEKFAIFCFNHSPSDGFLDVDWFHFSDRP